MKLCTPLIWSKWLSLQSQILYIYKSDQEFVKPRNKNLIRLSLRQYKKLVI